MNVKFDIEPKEKDFPTGKQNNQKSSIELKSQTYNRQRNVTR